MEIIRTQKLKAQDFKELHHTSTMRYIQKLLKASAVNAPWKNYSVS